jgi:hypothetical protein
MRCLHLVIPFAVALGASAAPFAAQAQIGIGISVTVAPPELPVYEQPPLPGPGYIFVPGYWAYGDAGYYWVPATWVLPPQPGLLWTPGYWGWNAGRYIFNAGYWGPTVGFYGGINYGFGYTGLGYEGGYWRGGAFFYNSAVNRFGGVHVTNVYEKTVTNVTVNRYAFNGPGGVNRQPTAQELQAAHEPHVAPTPMQVQHVQMAQQNRALLFSANHGHPAITATARPAAFPGGAAHPAAQPMASHAAAARPMAAAPHPVTRTAHSYGRPAVMHPMAHAPRPEGAMAPHPEGAMAPHPEGGMARRPEGATAPHPAARPAPHPAAPAEKDKPKH